MFPEGIKGIGKLYKERYQLQRFGRGGFIKLALKSDAPIIPTAVVGAEEIHPMLSKVTWLAKSIGIPYIPVTPTFPFLGPLGLVAAADQVVPRVRRAALLQRRVRRRRRQRSHPGQQARRAGALEDPGDDRRAFEGAALGPVRLAIRLLLFASLLLGACESTFGDKVRAWDVRGEYVFSYDDHLRSSSRPAAACGKRSQGPPTRSSSAAPRQILTLDLADFCMRQSCPAGVLGTHVSIDQVDPETEFVTPRHRSRRPSRLRRSRPRR